MSNLGLVHQAKEFGKLMSIFWYQEWAARLIQSASKNPTERMGIGAGGDAQNRMSVTLIAEFRRKGSVRVLRGSPERTRTQPAVLRLRTFGTAVKIG
jgi:hypothetical protein